MRAYSQRYHMTKNLPSKIQIGNIHINATSIRQKQVNKLQLAVFLEFICLPMACTHATFSWSPVHTDISAFF